MDKMPEFRKCWASVMPVVKTGFSLPSRTKQEFKDETDITLLVERYRKTGYFYDPLTGDRKQPRMPMFEDWSGDVDFQTAQDVVRRGNAAFAQIPAYIRRMFNDSPEAFLAIAAHPDKVEQFAASHPAARQAMQDLGLLKRGAGVATPATAEKPVTPGAPAAPENKSNE